MTHLKRHKIGKFWAVPRKGTTFLAVASHNKTESIPLVVVLRDIMKIVKTKKELQKTLNEKKVQINYKMIQDVNYPVNLFDVINLLSAKKNYKAMFSKNKKMIFMEVSEKEAQTKPFKMQGKKILPGRKMQFNLMHGRNIISSEKARIGDSVIVDLKDNKILKIIPVEKGRSAVIVKGRHMGHSGKINDIVVRGGREIAKIASGEGKLNVWTKNLIVIE